MIRRTPLADAKLYRQRLTDVRRRCLVPGDLSRMLRLLPRSVLDLLDAGRVESGTRHLPVHLTGRHCLLDCVCTRRRLVDALLHPTGEHLRAQLGRPASLPGIRILLRRVAARPAILVEAAASAHITAALSARCIRGIGPPRLPERQRLRFLLEIQRAVLPHFLAILGDQRARRVRRRLPGVRNQPLRPARGWTHRGGAIDRNISESRGESPLNLLNSRTANDRSRSEDLGSESILRSSMASDRNDSSVFPASTLSWLEESRCNVLSCEIADSRYEFRPQ